MTTRSTRPPTRRPPSPSPLEWRILAYVRDAASPLARGGTAWLAALNPEARTRLRLHLLGHDPWTPEQSRQVTRAVARLERGGLLTRETGLYRSFAHILRLTPAGHEALQNAPDASW